MASKIREELLHYIWKLKNFDMTDMVSTSGQKIEIIDGGYHNHDAGPDFLNAKIEVDGTLWVGHVELHINSSDWLRHRHDRDDSYQNVILHVVYNNDAIINRLDGTTIPTFEIGPRISPRMIAKHHQLFHHQKWVSCEDQITDTSEITKETTKDRALTQRLTRKSQELKEEMVLLGGDLNTLIYHRLAWSFGLRVNAESMKRLATITPLHIIQKHSDQPHQIEALLFGQSGLLPDKDDTTYVNILKREYQVLQQKFSLTPMSAVEWKYARLRPANFPTLRIAQFASFLKKNSRIENVIFTYSEKEIKETLDIKLDGYWDSHYKFDTVSDAKSKKIGEGTKRNIIINTVVPLLFMYGTDRESQAHKNRAISLLESLPYEKNSVIARWKELSMSVSSAADSQALLELKKHNCDQQACLSCPIGHKIMST